MRNVFSRPLAVVSLLLLVWIFSGCSEGIFWHMGSYNPWVVDKWKKEEQIAATSRSKREAIRQRTSRVRGLSDDEREKLSRELGDVYRSDETDIVRLDALNALGDLKTESSFLTLKAATKDAQAKFRVVACEGLAKQPRTETIAALQEVIGSDTDDHVRIAATAALGNFKDPSAVQALGLALEDSGPAVQYRAMRSLAKISDRDYGGNVDKWKLFVQGEDPQPDPPTSIADRIFGVFY